MLWSRRVRAPLTDVRVVEFGQLIADDRSESPFELAVAARRREARA